MRFIVRKHESSVYHYVASVRDNMWNVRRLAINCMVAIAYIYIAICTAA